MIKLKTIISMELLTYKRNRIIYFTLLILTVYIGIGYYHYLRNDYIEAGQMLQSSSYINMAASLLGLFFGYIIASSEKREHFQEILSSLPGNNMRPYGKIMSWFILNLIINLIAYVEVIVYFGIAGTEFLFFKKDIFIYIAAYWSGALFVAGILGYFIEVVFPYKWWNIALIFIVWILISPFNILLSSIIPNDILNYINLGENFIVTNYDDYLGLNIANSFVMNKVAFFLLAIFLFQGALFIKRYKKYNIIERNIYFTFMIITVVFLVILFNKRSESYIQKLEDAEYYSNEVNESIFYDNASADHELRAESYDIRISFDKLELRYTADVKLSENNKNVLPFTLYHGLNVSSVEINGELAKFKREGDWIYVQSKNDMDTLDISFQVNGNTGDLCPITGSSFFLSPTFPWYPVPGIFIIAEKSFYNYEPEYKNIHLNEPAEFHIVTGDKDLVFSNIEKIGQNEFHGFSKGAGLFSGMLIFKEIDGKRYLVPPDRINIIKSSLSIIERKINFIANIVGRPKKNIPETICVKPLYSFYPKYKLIYTEDCLFVSSDLKSLSAIADIKSVFRAFFWNYAYTTSEDIHGHVFEMMLEFIEKKDEYTELFKYASIDGNEINKYNEFLVNLSKKTMDLFNENDDDLEKLVKIMYNKIEREPDISKNIWFDTIEEIKTGDL